MTKRIYGSKVDLDTQSVSIFFENRAKKFNKDYPYVAVNYQDSNPSLTVARDQEEKQRILPLLTLSQYSSVLDIGCGIGRWADSLHSLIGSYTGTDFSAGLIQIAKDRFSEHENIKFINLAAQDTKKENLEGETDFNLVIISGLLIYLNDLDCLTLFENIANCVTKECQIYIREPVAIESRLTLNKIFSEELSAEYSAVYRTFDEVQALLAPALFNSGFKVQHRGKLFSTALSNRKETEQHFMILARE
ncbi:class I SAM-dependent methyltransferase [Rheinheimera soli]|jgi:SAM-dependent methyltransferase|uniref:2-polyprenyl-3-methyl-5-hydroxy-6-metoxy-1, 4-benzoquinol methylase n=1 Tax=Rheinheimera soli TaxID=443616 RepID=A0ABU1VU15_9GAMM|nr:class I SAM-dependent methyltransferase [Rheinheimera soli]MDR7119207.1 2-polyprenyl-3-methyl-5-hydroxy-6-metoxy-1,4-benzoquinol methylase [Rheinheimera soli]